jgi:LysR family hca operon transcriptional activator
MERQWFSTRYFVAVVEEGTTLPPSVGCIPQPSLSRQIRDLRQVGAELLSRSVHGVKLTAAGKAFRPPASRLQVDAAVEAARGCGATGQENVRHRFPNRARNRLPRAMHGCATN